MILCPQCGITLEEHQICPHHIIGPGWSEGNRIMCDFFHRGKIPTRLSEQERSDEDFWYSTSTPPIPDTGF